MSRDGRNPGDGRLTDAVQRMVVEAGCELEVARAIGRFEGWRMDDDEMRRRMMQCWRAQRGPAQGRRRFSADWIPIAVRVVAYHGGEDLVTGVIAEACYQGRREAEDALEAPRRGPVKARPRERRGAA